MSAHAHHRNYVKIWATLVVLLLISVFGPFLGIRVVTLIAAFGVAVVKAYMVAKNFMHLDIEKPIVHWVLATAVVLMVLLFAGLAPDVMMGSGSGWQKDAGFHMDARRGHGHAAEAHGAAPADEAAQEGAAEGGHVEH
jgi:caa(3)-type oxidase subunit IV